jgi:hypothetical protein
MFIGVVMCTYVKETEVKVCKRTPAVKLPARGLNSAPLIAYPDGRVGGKKIIGKEKKRMKATSTENCTEGRQREGEIREGSKDRKIGKRKEMQVEK